MKIFLVRPARPARHACMCAFLGALPLFVTVPTALSRQDDMPDTPAMHHGSHNDPSDSGDSPAVLAKRLSDKRESEFNHHLAGFFLVLAGTLILAGKRLTSRWPVVRYAWPICFLLAGVFVLIFSDTEIWPFGQKTLFHALSNPEVVQHKVFALILIALGIVEYERVRGRLKAAWSAWVFPVAAFAGAILLLFHPHEAGMHAPDAMNLMDRIQMQHRWFAAVGLGIAVTKGMSEAPTRWQHIFHKMWPALSVVLGILLMFYVE